MVNMSIHLIVLIGLMLIHNSICVPLIHKVDISETNIQECRRAMTYNEIHQLLTRSPCASNSNRKMRTKREDNPSSISHVYALQSTINDHRTIIDDHRKMINYLMNNTINITQLNDYYAEQHSKATPVWTSWRDISLLLLVFICVCTLIYILAKRFHPLEALTSILLRRHQNKQQQQGKSQMKVNNNEKGSMHYNPKDLQLPTVSTVQRDYMRYTHDSNSS